MFKLLILVCTIGLAIAHPSYTHGLRTYAIHSEVPVLRTKLIHEPSTVAVQEHTLAKVGEHVEQIPTAVSHQSQTIVHSKADKITPIVAPAVQTHYVPAVRTVEQQFVERIPLVQQYIVESAYKRVEPIAEYPICDDCHHSVVEDHKTPFVVESTEAPKVVNDSDDSVVVEAQPLPNSYKEQLTSNGYAFSEQSKESPVTVEENK